MELESEADKNQCLVLSTSTTSLPSSFQFQNQYEISSSSSSPTATATATIPSDADLWRSNSIGLHRCKTAPAMDMAAVVREIKSQLAHDSDHEEEEEDLKPVDMVKQSAVLLLVYLTMGVLFYALNRESFSVEETHPVVDALYFCIVTMCTIGYGDITPVTPLTKIFSCVFVLVGFGFIDILLTGVLTYVLDLQEKAILSDIHQNVILVDLDKGRMRIRLKVALALAVLFLCIAIGTLFLYFAESLSLVDSLYLSALSVTTVGYGDKAFSTLCGRLFASVWLLVSTLAVARAFLFLVEARIDKRQRTLAKWVLQRDITPHDLFAANINNNAFITKSEFVIYKLKEMGKIGEQDVSQICNQFSKLDPNNMGRITLADLLQNHQ